ncbi:MAG: glycosyltransferase family 2 protein [Thomasclavelia ramosa]
MLTPTYNRANYLLQLYDSLKNQTCLKFKWLIVDDGSTDETKEIVKNFINENIIQIEYLYKDNGGKHTALNLGFKTIDTPLTFVVDSDDVLTNFAIETILMDINKIQSNQYVGLCYLRGFDYNNVIGDEFLHEGYDNLNKVQSYIDNVSGDEAEISEKRIM